LISILSEYIPNYNVYLVLAIGDPMEYEKLTLHEYIFEQHPMVIMLLMIQKLALGYE
jgi:hypothetical protein